MGLVRQGGVVIPKSTSRELRFAEAIMHGRGREPKEVAPLLLIRPRESLSFIGCPWEAS